MIWLTENGIPFSIVFTKADKLKPKAIERNVTDYCNILLETWEEAPQYFITSSSKELGKDELLSYIDGLNNSFHTS